MNPQYSCGTSCWVQIGVVYYSVSEVLLVFFDFLSFKNDVSCDKSSVSPAFERKRQKHTLKK